MDKLSLQAFDTDEQFSGADQYIVSGYDGVAQGLAHGLDIRLNQTVSKIDWTGGVTVTTNQGTSLRDYVSQTVAVYGTLAMRNDEFIRAQFLIAEQVATPPAGAK